MNAIEPGSTGPTIIVGEFAVNARDQQHAAIEAFAAIWADSVWPPGLLSTTLLTSVDGQTVLHYARWTNDDAYNLFAQTQRRSLSERLDHAVSGIQRKMAVNYGLYRSFVRDHAAAPGCVVVVSVEFDGPDEARQRRWVDLAFEAMAADPALPAGGISGSFHVSTDGTRVLNYAEWSDEKAHEDALYQSGQGTVGRGPKWLELRNFAGVKSSSFRRYHPKLSLVPPQRQQAAHA